MAGNRAVASLVRDARHRAVSPPRAGSSTPLAGTLQRAPGDKPKDTSQAALGATLPGPAPTPAGPAPTVATPDALGATIPGVGNAPPVSGLANTAPGVGNPPPPDALANTVPGVGNPPPAFDKNAPLRGQAVRVSDAEVAEAFRRNPASVIRSPSTGWHNEMYFLDKGTGGIPQAFRVGDQIAVHPDYPGQATPLPQYSGDGTTGLTTRTTGPAQVAEPPKPVGKTAGTVGGGSDTIPPQRPEGEGTPRPKKWDPDALQKARPVTYKEARAAYRADPGSVIRSPNQYWHEQMYEFDQGSGKYYPKAYRIGNQIVVAPDYPGQATPLPQYSGDDKTGLGQPGGKGGPGGGPPGGAAPTGGTTSGTTGGAAPTGGTAPVGGTAPTGGTAPIAPTGGTAPKGGTAATGGPAKAGTGAPTADPTKAANVVGLPGTVYDAKTRGQSYTSTVTQSGDQTKVSDRKRELGMVTTGVETQTGDLTHRKETTKGAGFGTGGNVVGAQYGRVESTKIGDDIGVTKGTTGTAGITGEGKLQVGGERKTVVQHGVKPDGTPITTTKATTGGITVDPHSIGGNLNQSYTTKSGKEVTGGASFTADDKGNSSMSLTGGVKTKSGFGASVTVSSGHTVTADDPEEVSPGVWEVKYVVSDTDSVGGGVSGQSGMIGGGISGSVTDAKNQTGTRRFKTEKEAKAFKENAADQIAKSGGLAGSFLPVTTIPGALSIPIGESRGVGDSRTKAGSVSGTLGATISKSGQTTSAHEISIFRAGNTTVHVTYIITSSEGSDWGISGLGLANQKGGSESSLWALTYEFNLAAKEGADAFQSFVAIPFPPLSGARRVSVRTLNTQEDHDKYAMPGGFSDTWSGTTWQGRVEDDQGVHKQFGGKQSRDTTPGTIGKLLGDKEQHSNAQIVRASDNDKDTGARAQFDVSGESGSFNRDEFRKIFSDKRYGDATASGKWTLSAPVPMQAIRDLEAVHKGMRNAKTMDEKMRIYSELVKENGGRMLGGQVGMSSKAWDLELKGDANFPGPNGRAALNQQRKALADQLKAKPPKANDVVKQTGEAIDKLQKRRKDVADEKKYTDLPDGLRKQQVALIDRHIEEFRAVRRNAQSLAMRPPDGADAGPGGAGTQKADPAYKKLADRAQFAEVEIGRLRKEVKTSSKALGDAIGPKGSTALRAGVKSGDAETQIALAKSWISQATGHDKNQAALQPKIDQLREAWTAAKPGKDQVAAITALVQVLDERVKLMHQTIYAIQEAGKAVYPITTRGAMSGNPAFWRSLGMAEPEPERAPVTSMTL